MNDNHIAALERAVHEAEQAKAKAEEALAAAKAEAKAKAKTMNDVVEVLRDVVPLDPGETAVMWNMEVSWPGGNIVGQAMASDRTIGTVAQRLCGLGCKVTYTKLA